MVKACIRSPGGDGAPVMTTPSARAANGSGKITRDAVLAAALELIDRDGADALSMRKLARALDRDPMILYRRGPGKAAPLAGGTAAGPLAPPLALRPPGTLRPLEDILSLLTHAGFSGPDALHIYRALFGFLHGHVLNELQELVDNPDETDDLLRLGLYRLPITQFPLLRSLASALACYDGAAELERGLDILLAGRTTTLPSPDPGSSPGTPR